MNWYKGFSAAYYATEVDARTWKDTDRIEITGGSISRTDEGLRNSADIDCVNYDRAREIYVRIWMDARQGGDREHVALFTGLACAPDRDINGTLVTNSVKCFSVLQPCEDVLLPRGWYAPAGERVSTILSELLSVTPAPVRIEGTTPKLESHIVAEEGENHLTMIEKILLAIGWRMQVEGDGTVLIREKATAKSAVFDPLENDCIETQLNETYDWYSAPNVFRAATENRTVEYKDESDSILSVKNRGREIWFEETKCNLNDGESLEGYAERRLREEQQVNRKVSYTRRYIPDIYPSDIVELRYPRQEIDGSFYIVSQSISIGYGAPVSEEVNGI